MIKLAIRKSDLYDKSSTDVYEINPELKVTHVYSVALKYHNQKVK